MRRQTPRAGGHTPVRVRVPGGRRRAGQTARGESWDRVPLRFRALLTAIRVDGNLRLPPPLLDLPADVAEICDLVRQASPIGRQLVEAIFDDAAAPLRQATYLNEQATLASLLGEPALIETLNHALDELRRDMIHPNDVVSLLMDQFDQVMLPEVGDLWTGKGALEKLSMCLDIRRLVYKQIRDAAPDGLDPQLELEYRAQTVEWLHVLAALCDRIEVLLRERWTSDAHGEQSAVSLALFAAYADRAARLGEPLPIQTTTWLEEWRSRTEEASQGTNLLDASLQAARMVPVVGAVGLAPSVMPAQGIANPQEVAKSVWPGASEKLALVTTPWAAPAPEWKGWTYSAEPAPDVSGPVPQLRLQLKTTGTYSFNDLAQYFGLTSRQALRYITAENTETLARISPGAKTLPAGYTLVIPATLLPSSSVRALEDTAQTFDVDVEALA
ncbi:MAG: hypothetical protein KIT87_29455, partial [Anaerolineae bacterium]|nr:hypothetical protein [Anaerolineae bacterium]